MEELPNDFVVFWEHDKTPSRYLNKFDGSWDLLIKSSGTWQFYDNVGDATAARAFHEAESVCAIVDRSQPNVEALPPIPGCVYWNADHGNFYDSATRRGMGVQFFFKWQHRSAEFPQCDGFGCPVSMKVEVE